MFLSVIGWTGTVLLVIAYILLSYGKFHGKSKVYQAMNFFGGLFLAIEAGYKGVWSVVGLEVVWCSIAVMTIYSVLRK
jgi:hypothetical protein